MERGPRWSAGFIVNLERESQRKMLSRNENGLQLNLFRLAIRREKHSLFPRWLSENSWLCNILKCNGLLEDLGGFPQRCGSVTYSASGGRRITW